MKRRLSVLAPALFAAGFLVSASARAADPTTADCLAASEASFKSGNDHKLRAERAQLLTCASANCPADIRKECARRVDEVNAAIPTIIFEAKDASGADLSAVKVTMDSEVLAERLEGTALSIDPGEHSFIFETAGQPAVTRKLLIQEAQKERRELVTFGAATMPPSPQPPTAPQPMETAAPADESTDHLGKQKILGLAAAGVGLVGLGVGTVFGILTASAASQQKSACKSSMDCTDYAQAASHHSAGVTDGAVSTISFIAGGAFLAAGAVLFFTAKPAAGPSTDSAVEVVPSVGPGGGALILKGAF